MVRLIKIYLKKECNLYRRAISLSAVCVMSMMLVIMDILSDVRPCAVYRACLCVYL